ncbi:MAG: helix-turn-helix transcriptional regulator [Acidobacteria bacterium]|nr:helix-turn-helix transcriptional regulator [Acidobacteriota bacterium]
MERIDGIPKGVTPKTARKVTDEGNRALYVISVAAELAGVHPQTLRGYERRGLLRPARTEGRARRFSMRDIEHVRLIQSLTQEAGMSLAGVARVMDMTRELEEMQRHVAEMRAEMEQVRRRMEEEIERAQRAGRAEIVPFRREPPWEPFGPAGRRR